MAFKTVGVILAIVKSLPMTIIRSHQTTMVHLLYVDILSLVVSISLFDVNNPLPQCTRSPEVEDTCLLSLVTVVDSYEAIFPSLHLSKQNLPRNHIHDSSSFSPFLCELGVYAHP